MTALADIISFNPFQVQTLVYLLVVGGLLICSALISGSETAMFSLSPTNLKSLRDRDQRSDRAVMALLSRQDYMLAGILIANNLVNICIVILSNKVLDGFFSFGAPAWEFAIKVVIVTFVLLLFGEIIPKIYASYNPLRFARFISLPLTGLVNLLKPFSYILVKSSSRISESAAKRKVNISIDELSNAIEITENHTEEEKQMLSGIVSFVNTDASEIMKLRMDLVALDIECDFEEVKETIIRSGFSRIPVYAETIDNIEGILYVKDMLPFISQGADFEWQKHLRKAYFVPENKKINDLLEEFQESKVHIAIVVDEYGATQGLVSLEDILEEIVGEITDESDVEQPTFYKKINENTYIFEGKTHLYDLEKVLGLDEDYFQDVSAGAETVAGVMLEIRRDFLKKGDTVSSRGIDFTVTALDGRRIDKVKVTDNREL